MLGVEEEHVEVMQTAYGTRVPWIGMPRAGLQLHCTWVWVRRVLVQIQLACLQV